MAVPSFDYRMHRYIAYKNTLIAERPFLLFRGRNVGAQSHQIIQNEAEENVHDAAEEGRRGAAGQRWGGRWRRRGDSPRAGQTDVDDEVEETVVDEAAEGPFDDAFEEDDSDEAEKGLLLVQRVVLNSSRGPYFNLH